MVIWFANSSWRWGNQGCYTLALVSSCYAPCMSNVRYDFKFSLLIFTMLAFRISDGHCLHVTPTSSFDKVTLFWMITKHTSIHQREKDECQENKANRRMLSFPVSSSDQYHLESMLRISSREHDMEMWNVENQ